MTVRRRLAHYLRVAARYLEDPAQLRMRRHYFIPSLYAALSTPWLQAFRFATVLDIGASVGDFAFTIRPLLPDAQIYSFEPLPDCYQLMLDHLKGAAKFEAFNLALGEQSGELEFQRSGHSPSSSFLKMAASHKTAYPASADNRAVQVRMERLDDLAARLVLTEPMLVKIDVQGYEDHVLRGGQQTMQRASAVIIETSFEPLYEDQPLFSDVYSWLAAQGFTYVGGLDQLCDPYDQRPLQQDGLFVRRRGA
jgi:FkbM family methyltransferase